MNLLKSFILVVIFCSNSYANLHNKIRVTGQVYKKFTPTKVQIKDENEQVYEIARDAFPANFKVLDGKVFSIEIREDQIFYKKKKN